MNLRIQLAPDLVFMAAPRAVGVTEDEVDQAMRDAHSHQGGLTVQQNDIAQKLTAAASALRQMPASEVLH